MKTSQVFVSHTSDMARFPQGRSFVQAALDAVCRASMAPVDMRYFPASGARPAEYCREQVRACEIYVAVIGFRYGTMVPGEEVSYTELEFSEAGAAGLPRLVFLLADGADFPAAMADADRSAVESFRQRLSSAGMLIRSFTSDADLELEVFHALTALAASAPPAVEVRYSLPPDAAAFTGRDEELDRITMAVADATAVGSVIAIRGMPGVGKTALAVHVAHPLRAQFPDRQLFIDLRAYAPGQDPVPPEAALAGLLAAVGVDPRYLPADLAGRAGLWRDRMAGQRALLVLDNATGSSQVTPLLPGGVNCLVLVTSRRYLGDLPGTVVPVLVGALSPAQAQEMFLQLAPQAAAEPRPAVLELVMLAGCLPLAISLLARLYARHPSWTLAELIRETRESVLVLAAENESVAAALEMSYQYLPPGQQRFFRSLGLHPGSSIDAYAAAALAGVALQDAVAHLDALHGEGLLIETGYRRYSMHDLVRQYAQNLATACPADDQGRGLDSVLDYYQHAAALCEVKLARQSRTAPVSAALAALPAAIPGLQDRARALSWARAERSNILACLDYATRAEEHARVVALTAAIAAVLEKDGPWADAITRHITAIRAAQNLGDRLGEANALSNLGIVRHFTDDYSGATHAAQAALTIYRDIGDRQGHANALNDLGVVRYLTGDYPGAADALQEALHIYREIGDRQGQANALNSLGATQRQTTDYPGAAEAQDIALSIYRDISDQRGQASALSELGAVRRLTGNYPGAVAALDAALSMHRALDSQLGQASTLNYLGALRQQTGDYAAAAAALEEALRISGAIGDRQGQANALSNLGVLLRETGDHAGAARALQNALRIFREIGDRGGEAEALNETGTLHRILGDLDHAEACHRQALLLARQINIGWDEAHALAGLGRCARAARRTDEAENALRQALTIFRRIGAPEAANIAAELGAPAEPD
jgi:tetratricopeptide (TPR) repeat protein